ncbi:MAG TPA: hypothetical protein VKW78_00245 [Terriglobales bacterium]|nr:hypothetical protein [Terriglobales bacterium]
MPRKPATRNTKSAGSKAGKARQGIANRDTDEEVKRKLKVIPFSAENKALDRKQKTPKAS